MQRRTSLFGGAAVAGALVCGQILLMGSADSAFAQRDLDYEATGEFLVPRSWVTRWYVRAEYLALWTTGNPLPALVTTSPADTPRLDAGVLGEPGTEVLFGQEYAEDNGHQGGRLTFGYWFDDAHTRGVEAQLWAAGIAQDSLAATSLGDSILARPFFNTENNLEDAELIAFPSLVRGDIQADARSEVYSVDVLARYNWFKGYGAYLDFCWGYRFFRFRESLSIWETLVSAIGVADQFVTENDFHGADLGAVAGLQRGGWLLDVTAKVALGDMRERLSIDGATTVFANPPWTVPGGWLAAPSNVGVYTDHEFAAIPELGLRLAFVAFETIELSVGYNVIYVSSVLRTGEQVDRTVNPGQLAVLPLARGGGVPSGALRPRAGLDESSLWMHGISFGAELRW
jgi:hypothetical protein